jgi:DNA-binding NarL/FixJ family response regulator
MDIHLPVLNGIQATGEILRHLPDTRIAILSMYDDETSVVQALRAGARAFVLKTASHTELLEALRTVARGGSYLSPSVSDKFLSRVQRGDLAPRRQSPLDSLTPRELQVMRLIAGGKTSKEIAAILGLGVQTIRGYRKDLMRKLNVNNVAALTRIALDEDAAHPAQSFATA